MAVGYALNRYLYRSEKDIMEFRPIDIAAVLSIAAVLIGQIIAAITGRGVNRAEEAQKISSAYNELLGDVQGERAMLRERSRKLEEEVKKLRIEIAMLRDQLIAEQEKVRHQEIRIAELESRFDTGKFKNRG